MYLEKDRLSIVYSADQVVSRMVGEFNAAVRLLKPAQAKHYFGLTKARRYICPSCLKQVKDPYALTKMRLAQLAPNAPSATTVRCFVCGTTTSVIRRTCDFDGCRSNVIWEDSSWGLVCLVCGESRKEPDPDMLKEIELLKEIEREQRKLADSLRRRSLDGP